MIDAQFNQYNTKQFNHTITKILNYRYCLACVKKRRSPKYCKLGEEECTIHCLEDGLLDLDERPEQLCGKGCEAKANKTKIIRALKSCQNEKGSKQSKFSTLVQIFYSPAKSQDKKKIAKTKEDDEDRKSQVGSIHTLYISAK